MIFQLALLLLFTCYITWQVMMKSSRKMATQMVLVLGTELFIVLNY